MFRIQEEIVLSSNDCTGNDEYYRFSCGGPVRSDLLCAWWRGIGCPVLGQRIEFQSLAHILIEFDWDAQVSVESIGRIEVYQDFESG